MRRIAGKIVEKLRGSPGQQLPADIPRENLQHCRFSTTTRIVVYRRPLLARSESDPELNDLIFDVVIEEFARFLGLDPESVDPGYRGGLD